MTRLPDEAFDMTSIGVLAIVCIICVVMMVIGLSPQNVAATKDSENLVGGASTYDSRIKITATVDAALLDLNKDGEINFYDYADVMNGAVNCNVNPCDLDGNGFVDDTAVFNRMVVRIYDYDNDGQLTRADARLLGSILLGEATFDTNHIYDLNNDGYLSNEDITRYTALIFNYDNPIVQR